MQVYCINNISLKLSDNQFLTHRDRGFLFCWSIIAAQSNNRLQLHWFDSYLHLHKPSNIPDTQAIIFEENKLAKNKI